MSRRVLLLLWDFLGFGEHALNLETRGLSFCWLSPFSVGIFIRYELFYSFKNFLVFFLKGIIRLSIDHKILLIKWKGCLLFSDWDAIFLLHLYGFIFRLDALSYQVEYLRASHI